MKATCLIVWMAITLLLTFSIVGMILFIPNNTHYKSGPPDIRKSTWMEMGMKLLDSVLKESK